ncbi:MAG: HEAT repeat domain-containing protein, partial [Candidatus Freyarchaeota archaeon]|nr:HEAT repeat domain-containing protein [Candidatus Jordarchaeia archaeon]
MTGRVGILRSGFLDVVLSVSGVMATIFFLKPLVDLGYWIQLVNHLTAFVGLLLFSFSLLSSTNPFLFMPLLLFAYFSPLYISASFINLTVNSTIRAPSLFLVFLVFSIPFVLKTHYTRPTEISKSWKLVAMVTVAAGAIIIAVASFLWAGEFWYTYFVADSLFIVFPQAPFASTMLLLLYEFEGLKNTDLSIIITVTLAVMIALAYTLQKRKDYTSLVYFVLTLLLVLLILQLVLFALPITLPRTIAVIVPSTLIVLSCSLLKRHMFFSYISLSGLLLFLTVKIFGWPILPVALLDGMSHLWLLILVSTVFSLLGFTLISESTSPLLELRGVDPHPVHILKALSGVELISVGVLAPIIFLVFCLREAFIFAQPFLLLWSALATLGMLCLLASSTISYYHLTSIVYTPDFEKAVKRKKVNVLVRALNHRGSAVRWRAAICLGDVAGGESIPVLLSVALDANEEDYVKTAASDSLVKIASKMIKEGKEAEASYLLSKLCKLPKKITESLNLSPLVATLSGSRSKLGKSVANTLKTLGWSPKSDAERASYLVAEGQIEEAAKLGEAALTSLSGLLSESD